MGSSCTTAIDPWVHPACWVRLCEMNGASGCTVWGKWKCIQNVWKRSGQGTNDKNYDTVKRVQCQKQRIWVHANMFTRFGFSPLKWKSDFKGKTIHLWHVNLKESLSFSFLGSCWNEQCQCWIGGYELRGQFKVLLLPMHDDLCFHTLGMPHLPNAKLHYLCVVGPSTKPVATT